MKYIVDDDDDDETLRHHWRNDPTKVAFSLIAFVANSNHLFLANLD